MSAEVAILLGVYNGEATLARCLESIASQSYVDWQLVIVDDASTDDTRRILEIWQQRFGGKLQVIRNDTNLGLTKSLNRGLARIMARYTARIDADDWWAADKLALQLGFLRQHRDYGVIGCNYRNVGLQGAKQVLMPQSDEAIRASIIRRNPFAHSCVVFDTKLVQSIGGYDARVRYGQDYDLWLRCLPRTRLANLPDSLCWRSVGRGISVERQRQQMLQSMRTQLKYIRKYRLPLSSLWALAEPLGVVLAPRWLRQAKRQLVG